MAVDVGSPVLKVAVSSTALFDLAEEDAVFQVQGIEAYRRIQEERQGVPLNPGTAARLVRKLMAFNTTCGREVVEVVLASRNTGSTGLRVGRAIDSLGLPIDRRLFTGGGGVAPYLKAMGVGLFLSTNREDVHAATADGVPSAVVLPGAEVSGGADGELRVAFDGDCCLFGSESQQYFEREGLDAFNKHEAQSAEIPLTRGPMAAFLMSLGELKREGCPISTALVTARCAPADARVIRTMQVWGVETDALFALGGAPKAPFLQAFGADIFFDDQEKHVRPASRVVPSALTLIAG